MMTRTRKKRKMKAKAEPKPDQQHLYEGDQGKLGDYKGYKWGMFLRAPDIFFMFRRRCGDKLVPLGQIAEIRFGTKSGCDKFFLPKDITEKAVGEKISDKDFKDHYGIKRSEAGKLRIVSAGNKQAKVVESEYLEPEVHSLRDNDLIDIEVEKLARKALMVSDSKDDLKGTYVHKYIEWGEKQDYHEGTSVQGRITDERSWYDLTWALRPDLILPKIQQYRHIISTNTDHLICNSSLLSVFARETSVELLCAVLNSTITALFKQYFARMHGREGSLQLDVYSARIMLVPDPRQANSDVRKRLKKALTSMRKRKILPLVDYDSDSEELTGDLASPDRQELDDAVLELLGFTNAKERRAVQRELYSEITRIYREIRAGELVMRKYRAITARAGRPTAHSIADEIWDELGDKPVYRSPVDFIPPKVKSVEVTIPEGRAKITKGGLFEPAGVQIGDTIIPTDNMLSSTLIKLISDIGITGPVSIPVNPLTVRKALEDHAAYVDTTNTQFTELAAGLTADEHMQERVVRELWRRMRR